MKCPSCKCPIKCEPLDVPRQIRTFYCDHLAAPSNEVQVSEDLWVYSDLKVVRQLVEDRLDCKHSPETPYGVSD